MNVKVLLGAAALMLVLAALPALAHHSFAAEFDINQPITLKGKLTKMEWINPHGWIYIDVVGPDGKVANWGIEAGAPNALIRRGLRKTDFPVGSEILVEGFRARNGTTTANGITLKFSDGRNFFLGSAGTGAPAPGGER